MNTKKNAQKPQGFPDGERSATSFSLNDHANLEEGAMWPVAFALVKKAVR